jgi:hypothetical protein
VSDRGHIIVDRDIFDEALLRDPVYFRAWLWLVAEAAWKPREQEVVNGRAKAIIHLERGQLTHSLSYMAKAWNVTIKQVRTVLRRFKRGSWIVTQKGTLQTVITICNYDASQRYGDETGTQRGTQTGTQRARKGHRTNHLTKETKEGHFVAKPERSPESFTEGEWLERLEHHKQQGGWSSYWGPQPGTAGCLVPSHLIVRPVRKG